MRRTSSTTGNSQPLQTVKIVVWEDDGSWLGYLQEYPDYWTQGKTPENLKEHLVDLYRDVTSGEIPGIRKVEDLVISCNASNQETRLRRKTNN